MDPSSSAHGAEAARSAERRANELYWQSESSVNRIAEDLDLSKSALYGIIRPLGAGLGCPRCAEEVVFLNRTAKERQEATCPACSWEGRTGEVGDGGIGDADGSRRPAADAQSAEAGMGRAADDGRTDDEGTTLKHGGGNGHDAVRAALDAPERGARPGAGARSRPLAGRGPAPHGDPLGVDPPAIRRSGRTDEDGEAVDADLPAPAVGRAFGWSTRRTVAGGALLGAAAGLALVLWARRR